MSNPYGLKEVQSYHFPPSIDGISDPLPICTGLFLRLIDSPDIIKVENSAGIFIYNLNCELLAFELNVYQPKLNMEDYNGSC